MLPFNNDTSDIDQSIEMVRFQCGPDSRDACRINILFNRKELIYGRWWNIKIQHANSNVKAIIEQKINWWERIRKDKKELMKEYGVLSDLVIWREKLTSLECVALQHSKG